MTVDSLFFCLNNVPEAQLLGATWRDTLDVSQLSLHVKSLSWGHSGHICFALICPQHKLCRGLNNRTGLMRPILFESCCGVVAQN